MDVLPNGNLKLRLDARKESSGAGEQPLNPTTVLPTSGYTTEPPTGGATSTGTAPTPGSTIGFSTTPGSSISPGIRNPGGNPRRVALNLHNDHRRVHNAPRMRLTSQLNDDAQRYADKLARESLFVHDQQNRRQGENLRLQCAPGSDVDLVKKAVDAWYNEVCTYNFDNPRASSGVTGHFTQVVWKKSTRLGIGLARGSYAFGSHLFDNCLFVVGRYLKPGNVFGAYQQNVLRGSFNRQMCRSSNTSGKRNKLFRKLNSGESKRKSTLEMVL
ncbi:protein PRY1-like isoform X2 [Stylophora pistillata]|nr:protein PRY1-like isoform X2 [Stylophora pistillata]